MFLLIQNSKTRINLYILEWLILKDFMFLKLMIIIRSYSIGKNYSYETEIKESHIQAGEVDSGEAYQSCWFAQT